MASTLETVAALKRPIQQWTRGWMMGPPAEAKAAQLHLASGEQIWVVGRAGVIGDGDAIHLSAHEGEQPIFGRNLTQQRLIGSLAIVC